MINQSKACSGDVILAKNVNVDEHNLPALYMLWREKPLARSAVLPVPAEYTLRSYVEGDDNQLRSLLEIDGESMTQNEWQKYKDKVLPEGLFVIIHDNSKSLVATAGAAHNPNPGRYYFPFGGELGYLIVHPEHRGKRLGRIVCAQVVQRFLSAGYGSIRVAVLGWRYAAIKTYLRVGFEPFIHDRTLLTRWKRICKEIDWQYTPDDWPQPLN